MSEKIIVLVTDRGDSKHGEISIVDEPRKAELFLQWLSAVEREHQQLLSIQRPESAGEYLVGRFNATYNYRKG